MKITRRKIAVVALILCAAGVISMGTLAWFTADDSIENSWKFVTDFEVDLVEHDGTRLVGEGDDPIGLTFENVVPGSVLPKDPTVINKSSTESQWIRLTVTVDHAAEWASVIPEGTDLTSVFLGYREDLWTCPDGVSAIGTDRVAVFYLREKLSPGESRTLFTGIKIPETLTLEEARAIGEAHLTVKAEALQAEVADDVLEAFASLD